ncbi:hypothetical protein EDD15DRAFT_2263243 [Pisolithus albus]|nr:hypothetical protein EDD15DRAFT_2263243 [Pisolithus albus]
MPLCNSRYTISFNVEVCACILSYSITSDSCQTVNRRTELGTCHTPSLQLHPIRARDSSGRSRQGAPTLTGITSIRHWRSSDNKLSFTPSQSSDTAPFLSSNKTTISFYESTLIASSRVFLSTGSQCANPHRREQCRFAWSGRNANQSFALLAAILGVGTSSSIPPRRTLLTLGGKQRGEQDDRLGTLQRHDKNIPPLSRRIEDVSR